MADYFPLISKAIQALPDGGTSEQRRAIYDRARDALLRQLRSIEPPLPEGHVERERLQLENAISRLEAEIAQKAADHLNPVPVAMAAEPTAELPERATGVRLQAPPDIANDRHGSDERVGEGRDQTRRRPRVPLAGSEPEPPRSRSRIGVILAAGLPILIGLGVAAYILRDSPDRFKAPATTVASNGTDTASAPASTGSATTASTTAPAKAEPPPAQPAVPVAVRASLYEENSANPAQRLERRGAIVWRVEPDQIEGAPATQRVKGEIELPDANLNVEFTMRRNSDPTFPASHTLSLRFIPVAKDAPVVKSIGLPEFRQDPLVKGPILQGVIATVQDNEFLVALFNAEPVKSTNIELLKRPGWFAFELRFTDGRKGELLFEKGAAGERAFSEAFAAWGE